MLRERSTITRKLDIRKNIMSGRTKADVTLETERKKKQTFVFKHFENRLDSGDLTSYII